MKIEVLQAHSGDSILLTYSDKDSIKRNILIDGGTSTFYRKDLKWKLKELKDKNENIDLLIVTHIDTDHIGGIKSLFEDASMDKTFIKNVIFNTGKEMTKRIEEEIEELYLQDDILTTSVSQGIKFSKRLKELKINKLDFVECGQVIESIAGLDEVKLNILTPNCESIKGIEGVWKEQESLYTSGTSLDYDLSIEELVKKKFVEDDAKPNRSSISFILELKNKKYLFLGDACPTNIIEGLASFNYSKNNKLKVEVVKISHHGSKKNTNNELLEILDCNKFLVSSNGRVHGNPTKEALSRIIAKIDNTEIYFNYDLGSSIFTKEEEMKYSFKVEYKNIFEEI